MTNLKPVTVFLIPNQLPVGNLVSLFFIPQQLGSLLLRSLADSFVGDEAIWRRPTNRDLSDQSVSW